jgi:hypothetical protein
MNWLISKDGRLLWRGAAKDRLDAINQYRIELGTEALDYDAVKPDWVDDLAVDSDPDQMEDENDL